VKGNPHKIGGGEVFAYHEKQNRPKPGRGLNVQFMVPSKLSTLLRDILVKDESRHSPKQRSTVGKVLEIVPVVKFRCLPSQEISWLAVSWDFGETTKDRELRYDAKAVVNSVERAPVCATTRMSSR
jgi:hypothetical protein